MGTLLLPRAESWPFSGYFYGCRPGLTWAGRIGDGPDVQATWRASQLIRRALQACVFDAEEKKRRLSQLIYAMQEIQSDGAVPLDSLSFLAVATDIDGMAVTGMGLSEVYGCNDPGIVESLVAPPHPLLGPPGLSKEPMGVWVVPEGPQWLFGACVGSEERFSGRLSDEMFQICGMPQ